MVWLHNERVPQLKDARLEISRQHQDVKGKTNEKDKKEKFNNLPYNQ